MLGSLHLEAVGKQRVIVAAQLHKIRAGWSVGLQAERGLTDSWSGWCKTNLDTAGLAAAQLCVGAVVHLDAEISGLRPGDAQGTGLQCAVAGVFDDQYFGCSRVKRDIAEVQRVG